MTVIESKYKKGDTVFEASDDYDRIPTELVRMAFDSPKHKKDFIRGEVIEIKEGDFNYQYLVEFGDGSRRWVWQASLFGE
jgi:hypothetical protein